jgi:hypothetical protein
MQQWVEQRVEKVRWCLVTGTVLATISALAHWFTSLSGTLVYGLAFLSVAYYVAALVFAWRTASVINTSARLPGSPMD